MPEPAPTATTLPALRTLDLTTRRADAKDIYTGYAEHFNQRLDELDATASIEDAAAFCAEFERMAMRADVQSMAVRFAIGLASLKVIPFERAGRTLPNGEPTHGRQVIERFAAASGLSANVLREARAAAVKHFPKGMAEYLEWVVEPVLKNDEPEFAKPRTWTALLDHIRAKHDPDVHPADVRGRMLASGVERAAGNVRQLGEMREAGEISDDEYRGVQTAAVEAINEGLDGGGEDGREAAEQRSVSAGPWTIELWVLDREGGSVRAVESVGRDGIVLGDGEIVEPGGRYTLVRTKERHGQTDLLPINVQFGTDTFNKDF